MTTRLDFETLYVKYYPVLMRFAKRYTSEDTVAENVVQELFTKVWENPTLLEGIRSEANYLLTMCKNACIDHLRREKGSEVFSQMSDGQKWLVEERLQSLYQLDQIDPYEEDVFKLLEESIEALPEQCRKILKLYRFQGLTYQEIADTLEISPRTVESQLRIAMQKLRKSLPPSLLLLLFTIW